MKDILNLVVVSPLPHDIQVRDDTSALVCARQIDPSLKPDNRRGRWIVRSAVDMQAVQMHTGVNQRRQHISARQDELTR